jgi:hypothetical protein
MVRSISWFALGVIAASVFFLRWSSLSTSSGVVRSDDDGGQLAESEFDIDDSIRLPSSATEGNSAGESSSGDRSSDSANREPSPRLSESVEQSQLLNEAPFEGLAAATSRTPEEVERIVEQSFSYIGQFRNRHDVFASEVGGTSTELQALENAVTNEVWRIAGSTYPPVFLETECRASACRVRLSYGTDGELSAAAQSNLDSRLLVDLERYGFVAVEAAPGSAAREFDPDSAPQGPTLDIYYWRRSESGPQALVDSASV